MGLIGFLLLVVIVGFLCYLAVRFVPMPEPFKTALPFIAIVVLLIILAIYMFGLPAHDVPIPRVR